MGQWMQRLESYPVRLLTQVHAKSGKPFGCTIVKVGRVRQG
jgi:hypothetical protein